MTSAARPTPARVLFCRFPPGWYHLRADGSVCGEADAVEVKG